MECDQSRGCLLTRVVVSCFCSFAGHEGICGICKHALHCSLPQHLVVQEVAHHKGRVVGVPK